MAFAINLRKNRITEYYTPSRQHVKTKEERNRRPLDRSSPILCQQLLGTFPIACTLSPPGPRRRLLLQLGQPLADLLEHIFRWRDLPVIDANGTGFKNRAAFWNIGMLCGT